MGGFNFNPILSEIHSHMQAMSPGAQAAVKMANPSIPAPDPTMTAPGVLPGMLLPHPDAGPPAGNIAMPSPSPSLSMPSSQPAVRAPLGTTEGDTSERGRLLSTGSGISQIGGRIENSRLGQAHPFVGRLLGDLAQGAATVGDIGLSTLGGGIGRLAAQEIPGTEEHHNLLLHRANTAVTQDEANAEKEAQTANANATAAKTNAETPTVAPEAEARIAAQNATASEAPSVIAKNEAEVKGLENPFGKSPDREPISNVEQINKGMNDRYQVLHPGVQAPGEFQLPANATKGDFERIDKLLTAEENASGNQANHEESVRMRQAMLALATQRLGDAETKGKKPTPDEQRRADLSENLNENLGALEEILNRRPELFGPLAGRWTELRGKFGSDDADIGALQTIEHQIGMAQISAHGMRSAMGIQSAADSIMNHMHSSPKALLGAISAARNSVSTFQGDVDKAKGVKGAEVPQGGKPNDPLGIR